MDRFTDSFRLGIVNMLLKCNKVSLVVDPSFVYLCSKTHSLILFQIAAASYKKVAKSDGIIAIK